MKKIILIATLALGLTTIATAGTGETAATPQPKAVGVRIGWGAEISYQQSMGENFIEVDLGIDQFNSIDFATLYNLTIARPEWTEEGQWGIYAGPGAALGMRVFGERNFFHIAAACMVGIEYTFSMPLQLSFDIKPQLGVGFGYGFYWRMTPSFGVRYRF